MPTELQELIADLEHSIGDTIDRIDQTELRLLYIGVLDLEQRIETLRDAFDLAADLRFDPERS